VMGLMLDGFRTRPEPPTARVVPAEKLVSALCRATPDAVRLQANSATPA
jgi:hypothetical protein